MSCHCSVGQRLRHQRSGAVAGSWKEEPVVSVDSANESERLVLSPNLMIQKVVVSVRHLH